VANVNATGNVVVSKYSRLGMQVSGRIKELPVKSGDTVRAGAVLAKIDSAPIEVRLDQARSALKTSQLKLEQLRAGPRPEEIAQAEASIRGAQGRLADLQAGALPQEVAAAQSAADNAAAAVRQAQARRDGLFSGATAAEIATAEQVLKVAQANVDNATTNLSKLTTPNPDELAAARTQVEKSAAAVRQARAAYDRFGWRPDAAARPEGLALQQATLDHENALAQLRLKEQPRAQDVEIAQRAIDTAQTQVVAAQARLDQLRAGPASEDIRAAQAAIEGAQASHQQALARVEALKQGAKPGDVQAAQSAVVQAQQQLALKRAPVLPQEIALAEEAVNQAQINVRQVQLDLDNATLVAPFDGLVTAMAIGIGEFVGTVQVREFVTLIDPRSMKIEVGVDEADIARIAVGNPAKLAFDAIPGRTFPGKVTGIATGPIVQGGLNTYIVAIHPDDGSIGIQPGMAASASVTVGQKENVVVVPSRAIKRSSAGGQTVDVVRGQRTEPRPIKTGLANAQYVEVLEGVAPGEMVVIPATIAVAATR
jgi:HlyD family secretion protein